MKKTILSLLIAVLFVGVLSAFAEQAKPDAEKVKKLNEALAFNSVRGFADVAGFYARFEGNGFYWDDGTSVLEYFCWISNERNGYHFKYFGNGKPGKPHDSTRFIFLSFPISLDTGGTVFLTDESGVVYSAPVSTPEEIKAVSEASTDWNAAPGTPGILKIADPMNFTRDNRPDIIEQRGENDHTVVSRINEFYSAASRFAGKHGGKYWDSGTTDFKPFIDFPLEQHGYVFKYFANGEPGNLNDSTRFVLLAYPQSSLTGTKALFIDDSGLEHHADDIDEEKISWLVEAKPNWDGKSGTRHVLVVNPAIRFFAVFALQYVKSFGTAASDFSNNNADNWFWDSGTTDFSPYFSFASPQKGYVFKYFANGNPDPPHNSTRFIILGIPQTPDTCLHAYFLDESQAVFESCELDEKKIELLMKAEPNWDEEAGSADVLKVDKSVTFTRK